MIGKVLPCIASTMSDSCFRRMKNYSNQWITGSTNHRASNVTLSTTWLLNSIKVAMLCLHTEQAKAAMMPITKSHPTTKSLPALVKPMYTAGKAQHEA